MAKYPPRNLNATKPSGIEIIATMIADGMTAK